MSVSTVERQQLENYLTAENPFSVHKLVRKIKRILHKLPKYLVITALFITINKN